MNPSTVLSIYCYQCDTINTYNCSDSNIQKLHTHYLRPMRCKASDFFCVKETKMLGRKTIGTIAAGDPQATRKCSTSVKSGCYWANSVQYCSYSCNTNYCNGSGRMTVNGVIIGLGVVLRLI